MIIAIDGPAGSGKSTVAKALATKLRAHYLDTGAMYRSVALAATDRDLSLEDETAVGEVAEAVKIEFEHEADSPIPTRVLLDGEDVTYAIRTAEIDAAVSAVARLPRVREAMVALQRSMRTSGTLVVEGRDIGTVVFPDADVKVFLTASAEERSRRRHLEREERGEMVAAAEVHEDMLARDTADSTRTTAPLARAADATKIDTTGLTVDDVVEAIIAIVVAHESMELPSEGDW